MKRCAKDFLFGKVADPYIFSRPPPPHMEKFSEPDYIALLKAALEKEGISYVHMNCIAEGNATPVIIERWRVYLVRSFVWMERVYIIRTSFSEDEFAQWPHILQTIWRTTEIEVPTGPLRPLP
jgi:hypothetical protein